MTTYEDAVSIILNSVHTLPAEEKPLSTSLGQVTAEDIYSPVTLPQCASAGPDGYAVRSADVAGASYENPIALRIQETVRAGRLPKHKVDAGVAFRVMTGATMPDGADCVIRFEDTDEPTEKNGPNPASPTTVKIFVAPAPGVNILNAGHIVQNGALVAPKGTVIGPAQISALTAIGIGRVKVIRRPVVAIICTGDELISGRGHLPPGRLFNSNGPALAAMVRQHGGIARVLGIARDNRASLGKKLSQGMSADVIVTSGGVSKGDYDLVRLVLGEMGKVCFSRIQMGPGASMSFGVVAACAGSGGREVPVFALAGPPAGCLINFETLVRPAMRKMIGHACLTHPEVEAVTLQSIANRAPFSFVRWTKLMRTADGYTVSFNGAGGPGNLISLADSNSLTILPKGTNLQPGDSVKVLPLD